MLWHITDTQPNINVLVAGEVVTTEQLYLSLHSHQIPHITICSHPYRPLTAQSVMNAAARLIVSSSKFHHITPLLRQLHWLKAPERIAFKCAVLVYKCLHGSAPSCVIDELCQVADVKARQRLRSSSSSSLIVSRTRLSTVGDRAFPVAAARVWNSLHEHVTSAPSAAVFRSRLKTHLFDISYPDPVWLYSACAVTLVAFGHYNRPCYWLTYLLL